MNLSSVRKLLFRERRNTCKPYRLGYGIAVSFVPKLDEQVCLQEDVTCSFVKSPFDNRIHKAHPVFCLGIVFTVRVKMPRMLNVASVTALPARVDYVKKYRSQLAASD